jgi:hypothetical protein
MNAVPAPDHSTPFDLRVYDSVFSDLNEASNVNELDSLATLSSGCPILSQTGIEVFDPAAWDVTWAIFDEHSLAASLSHRPTDMKVEILLSFPFLDKFTSSSGLAQSFDCGDSQLASSHTMVNPDVEACGSMSTTQYACASTSLDWVEITKAALSHAPSTLGNDHDTGRLLQQTHDIVAQIRRSVLDKPRRSIITSTWSSSLETMCYEFFRPTKLCTCLALFWSHWYPNWPTIHRPTFDASTKTPILVAAMAVIGAILSPNARDRALAQLWFDPIEELVFDHDVFTCQNPSAVWRGTSSTECRNVQLDILQAAYCACLYQTWEGGKQNRRRIVRHRFNSMVFVSAAKKPYSAQLTC